MCHCMGWIPHFKFLLFMWQYLPLLFSYLYVHMYNHIVLTCVLHHNCLLHTHLLPCVLWTHVLKYFLLFLDLKVLNKTSNCLNWYLLSSVENFLKQVFKWVSSFWILFVMRCSMWILREFPMNVVMCDKLLDVVHIRSNLSDFNAFSLSSVVLYIILTVHFCIFVVQKFSLSLSYEKMILFLT